MLLLIAYDLHPAPGRDYSLIENAVKAYGIWAHVESSVWIIDTEEQPQAIIQRLEGVGHPADTFFVVRIQKNWWSKGLTAPVLEWLHDNSRRW